MSQNFQAGDFLLFQLDSGYGLMRILAIENNPSGGRVWHLAAYEELFLDPEMAENYLEANANLKLREAHMALTDRAFESTPVARFGNRPLTAEELAPLAIWRENSANQPSDISARLMLGLR